MYQKSQTRLDPMMHVMHYDLLEVAHKLMENKQNRAYWDAVPVPKQPVGRIRFEEVRQVATFAVPLLGLVWAYLAHGLLGLIVALPVAWLVGFGLDLMLKKAIADKLVRDKKIDSGRFRATKYLADQMGMAPVDITLPIIYKMAADFRTVDSQKKAAELKAEADRKAAIERSVSRRPYKGSTEAAASGPAGVAVADTYESTVDDEPAYSYLGAFNPTTGLPMIQGMPMDVGGNHFGTGHM